MLERATPKQLLNLEDYNHYLLEDSDVLWEVHCRRDFKKVVSLGLFKCLATNKRVEEQAREREWLRRSWRSLFGRRKLKKVFGERSWIEWLGRSWR